LADFESCIGLYVSETDPIGTILGARTPDEKFRPAGPKAQLGWAAVGHVPKGLRNHAIPSAAQLLWAAALGSWGEHFPKGVRFCSAARGRIAANW